MGEQISGSRRLSEQETEGEGSLAVIDRAAEEGEERPGADASGGGAAPGRRRFTIASLVSTSVVTLPFLWILWGPWMIPDPIRKTTFENNFYDLQARAMFHGHLWLANGSVGVEGFIHDGREFTYFGLFPSILRMPVLLVTSRLDGYLTAPMMLTAWFVTALFLSLLLWRLRVLIVGSKDMGRSEAVSFGLLQACVMGGSVFLLLAATPYVFNEDLAWSICLTIGSLFALLGLLERPSWGRISAAGVLVLCANLDRLTTGWACAGAAVLIALWFASGRAGDPFRRWWVPTLLVGLVPLAAGCLVNYAKFGVFFGLPIVDQVYSHVNAYRQQFLHANHDSEVGTAFIPTNVLAYLRPTGLHISSVFPYVTLPEAPPEALAHVLFDKRYRTASVPASMPLLTVLSIWGLVTAFRPRPVGRVALTRVLLLASGGAAAALLLWGYVAPRYLADFVPFLALAGAVAMIDIWRRLDGRTATRRFWVTAVLGVATVFSVVASFGTAVTPTDEWSSTQVRHYVEFQNAVSGVTGHPLQGQVLRGEKLPAWGPAGTLFVIGDCDGLYVSNGESYSSVPAQQFTRETWMTVELGHPFQHTFELRVPASGTGSPVRVPLVSVGPTTVSMAAQPATAGAVRVTFAASGPSGLTPSLVGSLDAGSVNQLVVVTDTAKHQVRVELNGLVVLQLVLPLRAGPVVVNAPPGSSPGGEGGGVVEVANVTASSPGPALCRSLLP